MQECFVLIPTIDKPGCNPDFEIDKKNLSRISILGNHKNVSYKDVKRTCQICASAHDKFSQQDLSYSRDMVLDSINGKTRSYVQGKIRATNEPYMDQGLAAYWFAMTAIFHDEPNTLHQLTTLVRQVKPQDFPGKNINKLVEQMHVACHFLDRNNSKPPDIVTIIMKSFLLCTVLGFTTHMQTLKSIKSPIIDDADLLLSEGSRMYEEININQGWTAKAHKPSSFNAEHQQRNNTPTPPPGTFSICKETTPPTKIRRVIDITPPGPGQPTERTSPDGKKEIWCTRPRCCIPPQEGKDYSRPGKWVTHPDTDEGHKASWDYADKKKKQQLDKRAAARNGTSSSRGHATLAHTNLHMKHHANDDPNPIEERLVTPNPNTDPDADPTLNHPMPHQASWWTSAYLN